MTPQDTTPDPTVWSLWRRNGLIWAALMLLLAASVAFAYISIRLFTPIIGVVIAVIKAMLVVVFLMELLRSKTLIHLTAMAGLVFLAALFALTLADVLTRLENA